MCGLIASTGKIESRYTVALGCLSESRGSESAGVAWSVDGKVRVAKIAQNPLVAFPVTLAPAIRHASKYATALIGHTRQATTGAVKHENAHPFYDKESGISWAHNGVITNYQTFGDYEVDSECLIHGIKKRDFSEFFGMIALVWLEGGKLHAFRKGNPLYRGIRNKAVYLASEEDMLKEIGCKKVKELAEAQVYQWDGMNLVSHQRVPVREIVYSGSSRSNYCEDYELSDNYHESWWEKDKREKEEKEMLESKTHTCHTQCLARRKTNGIVRSLIPIDRGNSGTIVDVETACVECHEKAKLASSDYCGECYLRVGGFYGEGD